MSMNGLYRNETANEIGKLAAEREKKAAVRPPESFEEAVTGVSREAFQQAACNPVPAAERIYQLKLQLARLEAHSQISMEIPTASGIPGGSWIKKLVGRLTLITLRPLMERQNAYNLEAAECIRAVLKELEMLQEKEI